MKRFTLVRDSAVARGLRVVVSALAALMAASCGAPDPASSFDGEEPIGTVTQALAPSCLRGDLRLTQFPLDGTNGRDWLIFNYVDRDSTTGLRDYRGNTGGLARTYDGHPALDISIPSFREMDSEEAVVRAAAPGRVESLHQAEFDRNQICFQPWNYVAIRHANGYEMWYGHLKKDSVLVSVGQDVTAGTVLGIAGSSGCSTLPHLHFEVHDCNGSVVDTNTGPTMWDSQPTYNPASDVMDVMLTAGPVPNMQNVVDPRPNPSNLPPNATLGVGLSLAVRGGDSLSVRVTRPNGQRITRNGSVTGPARFAQRFAPIDDFCGCISFPGGLSFDVGSTTGNLTVQVYVNGQLKATRNVAITNQVMRHQVAASDIRKLIDDLSYWGYRVTWIDGYESSTADPFYNLLFGPKDFDSVPRWDATSEWYQTSFDVLVGQEGYRLTQVDSYLVNNEIRYAALFLKKPGPGWTAYHGASEADHNAAFASLSSQGFRPVSISTVNVGGVRSFAALWDLASVGTFTVSQGVTEEQYQTDFNAALAAGRTLQYLNYFVEDGVPKINAIFNSVGIGAWSASHGHTFESFQTEYDAQAANGLPARAITGYTNGGNSVFATFFSQSPPP